MTSQDTSFNLPASHLPPEKRRKKWYKRWWGRTIIAFIFLLLVIMVAMAFYVGRTAYLLNTGEITPEDLFGENILSKQAGNLVTYATEDDPSLGSPDSKVVIVEFSDFQCPFCRQAHPVIKQILRDYGDKIFFVYRDFPIEDIHPQAITAAMAGECAQDQGKFWELHDKIFENQDDLSLQNLKIWAIQIGLSSIQFSDCLDSAKYFEEVQQDFRDGVAAGVRATPTFFINGKRIEGAIPFITFEQIILSELSRQ